MRVGLKNYMGSIADGPEMSTLCAGRLIERIQLHPGSGCPVLSAHFESSVPGLHFASSSAVPSYGRKMRFVSGASYAAHSITQGALSRTV
jgi:hypothetical protein